MDKLKAMESFVSVATRGSLTAAAQAEGVAPAIMGRRLDALEQRLGVRLLVRTTRRITLTPEGGAYLDDCQRLLIDLANAEASVSAGGVKAGGHLRITAPAGFGRRHVAPLMPGFLASHADITMSLNLNDRVIDLTAEGLDCAVRVGDLPDSSLVGVRLAENQRRCVAAPGYLQRHGTPLHPNELSRFDCLTLSSGAAQSRGWAFRVPRNAQGRQQEGDPAGAGVPRSAQGRQQEGDPTGAGVPRNAQGRQQEGDPAGAGVLRNALGRQQESVLTDAAAGSDCDVIHLRPGGALDCTDGEVLHDWCLAGQGIAWRSTWEVASDLASGRLVEVLADFAAPPNGIYAVFPQRRHLPLRVRLWIDFLKQRYGEPGYWQAA